MKRHVKLFFLAFFFVALCIVFVVFQRQEHSSIMGCPSITEAEAAIMIVDKELREAPFELLYFQGQLLPYRSDLNTFLVPVTALGFAMGNISSVDQGKIYFVLADDQETDRVYEGKDTLSVYIIDDISYIKTSVTFTTSTILTFQTDEFENGNAYGEMKLYTPADEEINSYSYKHSKAKLSYAEPEERLPLKERNYELKLFKNGSENKMNLGGLRKDDDWELDSLLDCAPQILQFYEEWNNFCAAENENRFAIQYQVVELYLDEQFMGDYLLKVPVDDKQLQGFQGTWLAEAEMKSAIYGSQIQELFSNIIPDPAIGMECSYWQEDGGSIFAIPKRCFRITETEIGRYQ